MLERINQPELKLSPMKFLFFVFAVAMSTVVAWAQPKKNNNIVVGKVDSIKSTILGEERKIWVHLPDAARDSSKHFPILYLLDGDWHFSGVVGMMQQLSSVNGNTVVPEMIVVGIPNTDRNRDLTPTHSLFYPDGSKGDDLKSSGGGEKFVSFIQKELMPYIDSVYHPAPYRVLVGHSFGGLTVMNIVINHTNMFNSYVAIEPSMWWDKRKLLDQAHEVMQQRKFAGKSLFLGIANTMPAGVDTLQVRTDTTGSTAHIRSILALKDILQHNAANGLNWAYKYYDSDDHSSAPLIATYDAFHFLFNFYNMPKEMRFKLNDLRDKADPAPLFATHYAEISRHMGYTILPPEDATNGWGYYYMQVGAANKAYSMFALNIHNYPGSFNVYDGMGNYYRNQKNKAKAMEYYNKALKIKDNPETKKKLDDLQREK